MAVNLKTATPDTTLPTTGFLFGADSQSASSPSVYPLSALAQTLLGSTVFSGDTVTASKPLLDMAQTWNNAAVTFTADKINVTNTASNAASLLIDRQVNGVSKFSVRQDGILDAAGLRTSGNLTLGTDNNILALSRVTFTLGGSNNALSIAANAMRLARDAVLGWQSAGDSAAGTTDIALARDAANTLALRNGTNAQAFNVYKTYTDASNYERLKIGFDGTRFAFDTQSLGTGAANELSFKQGGNVALQLSSTSAYIGGSLFWTSDNTRDIGAIASGRPRNIYAAGKIKGQHQTDTAYVATPQTNTGYLTMYDSTGTAYKVMVAA